VDDLHFEAIKALDRCRFLPGSWDKRFAQGLASKRIDDELTEKQVFWLKKLVYKYRKQIERRSPEFDDKIGIDSTFDVLDQDAPPGSRSKPGLRSGRRYSSDEWRQISYLQKRYAPGELPEYIGDYWTS